MKLVTSKKCRHIFRGLVHWWNFRLRSPPLFHKNKCLNLHNFANQIMNLKTSYPIISCPHKLQATVASRQTIFRHNQCLFKNPDGANMTNIIIQDTTMTKSTNSATLPWYYTTTYINTTSLRYTIHAWKSRSIPAQVWTAYVETLWSLGSSPTHY